MENIIYDKNSIEFVTVGVEFCSLMENARNFTRAEFVRKTAVVLPLLYLKATLLSKDNEEEFEGFPEQFVSEAEYEMVRAQVAAVMESQDDYLETFHPDMAFSDMPIAAFISEDLADIYQDIKNLAFAYSTRQEESMRVALDVCRTSFYEYWGQKLTNAMGALHHVLNDIENNGDENEDEGDFTSVKDENSLFGYANDNDNIDEEIF
ncbi:MAG: DUF5063 domain-containing protein [Bacteroidales bacterium]